MRHIVLITYVTPTATNYGAASALPYHIAKYRPQDVALTIYTFNANNVGAEELTRISAAVHADVKIMPLPASYRKIVQSKLKKLWLPYPFLYYLTLEQSYVDEINGLHPDGLWIYSEEWDLIVRQFPNKKIVHLFPDCQSLYCSRIVKEKPEQSNSLADQLKNRLMHLRYKWMEGSFLTGKNILNCLVGEADKNTFLANSPRSNAIFLRHPHYDVCDKAICFGKPKIRLLVAGKNNFYMYSGGQEFVRALCDNPDLAQSYQLTFLGKGWSREGATLTSVGYKAVAIEYVEDYIGEVIKHDIQVTPIVVGTGTKGKVLDAIANGLLVIGTPYALENIAVEDGRSCVAYRSKDELIHTLNDIVQHQSRYEAIARSGQQLVLQMHGRELVAQQMFDWYR